MSLAVSPLRSCALRRLRAVGAIGLSVTLLGGCFAFEGGRRPLFDHAHYAPVDGQAEDIFIEPVGHVDRTIPNRLGRLDVAPVNYSFETDQAARARAKLTLPPQPQILPPVSPETAPSATPQAAPPKPSRSRGPARPVTPGLAPADPNLAPKTQSQALPLTDPVVGIVPHQAGPSDVPQPSTTAPVAPGIQGAAPIVRYERWSAKP